jgi:hypothetical protein
MPLPKFKAYHKAENKICDVKILTDNGAFLVGIKKGEDTVDGRSIILALEDGRFCLEEEFELLYPTGILDKKGKEIYTGYILQNTSRMIFVVVFEDAAFKLQIHKSPTSAHYIPMSNGGCLNKTVIGNIYQHKNLLE